MSNCVKNLECWCHLKPKLNFGQESKLKGTLLSNLSLMSVSWKTLPGLVQRYIQRYVDILAGSDLAMKQI